MPMLIIDDREIEAPEGTKVIDAAERLGIMIPRFCYHDALGAVGACRMCAVKFLQGPFKGVQMSCLVDSKDGMVVSTTDEEAVAFRKRVIEWLMINHPHDCPVCDEGGQCLLQDETVSSGHGIRRYPGKKRTYRDQYLGVFIKHEMNRCIHCYRCSRFYREYAGYRDLGPLRVANQVYFGRFCNGQLESPFSGNLVDICPTGVYTDKPARFKIRRWDLQRAPSLCIHCSLGCNTIANAQYRAVMRVEGRFNDAVNGYFLCDAGRFGFSYTNGGANHLGRRWEAAVDGVETTAGQAMTAAAERIGAIVKKAGPGAVALAASSRNSLETQCMMKRLARLKNFRAPAFFHDPLLLEKARAAVNRLGPDIAASQRQIESADFVLVAGADPLNEGGMAALAIRQAFRKGARVVVIDPRPVFMPLEFEHIPARPDEIEAVMGAVLRASAGPVLESLDKARRSFYDSLPKESAGSDARIGELGKALEGAKFPVIVCGTDVVSGSTPAFAAEYARFLAGWKGRAGIFYILPGAGSFSGAMLSAPGSSIEELIEAIERGEVTALVAVESDPFRYYPDRRRLEQALGRLELLIAIEYLPTETAARAQVVIPASTVFETGSTYINQEGRVQFSEKTHHGGIPVWGSRPHPPRTFRDTVPGGEHRPAWEILAGIGRAVSPPGGFDVPDFPGDWISEEDPALSDFKTLGYPLDGLRITAQTRGEGPAPAPGKIPALASPPAPTEFELLMVDWMFGTEELAAYADSVHGIVPEPFALMHAEDANQAGFMPGETLRIELDHGPVQVKLAISEKMARNVLIIPRHWDLEWRKMSAFSARVPLERIGRV